MTRRTVRRCGAEIRWQVRCPRSWEALERTGDPDVRHCAQCGEDVHFCRHDQATLEHARAGRCIAREEPSPSELPLLVLGRPRPPVEPSAAEEAALRRAHRERGIAEAIRAIDTAPRVCPDCAYPVPSFRERCYVCERQVGRL